MPVCWIIRQAAACLSVRDLQLLQSVESVTKAMPAGLPVTAAYEELLKPERRVAAFITRMSPRRRPMKSKRDWWRPRLCHPPGHRKGA